MDTKIEAAKAILLKEYSRKLDVIDKLVARWNRHHMESGDFVRGLCDGWAQAIALLLGTEFAAVKKSLQDGKL